MKMTEKERTNKERKKKEREEEREGETTVERDERTAKPEEQHNKRGLNGIESF